MGEQTCRQMLYAKDAIRTSRAALGLSVLCGELPTLDVAAATYLVHRCRLPQPRVILGPQLVGIASAGIDISDGLVADLKHICTVSNLCATIEATAVPLAPAAAAAIDGNSQRLAMALTGGDDYEVLFTAHPDETDRINALSRSSGIAITSIGRMSAPSQHEEPAVIVRNKLGEPLHFACEGWTHFGKQG